MQYFLKARVRTGKKTGLSYPEYEIYISVVKIFLSDTRTLLQDNLNDRNFQAKTTFHIKLFFYYQF